MGIFRCSKSFNQPLKRVNGRIDLKYPGRNSLGRILLLESIGVSDPPCIQWTTRFQILKAHLT
ncbi:hypothetical protein Hanom_Chr13g01221221 [Helianthus anomalus]